MSGAEARCAELVRQREWLAAAEAEGGVGGAMSDLRGHAQHMEALAGLLHASETKAQAALAEVASAAAGGKRRPACSPHVCSPDVPARWLRPLPRRPERRASPLVSSLRPPEPVTR